MLHTFPMGREEGKTSKNSAVVVVRNLLPFSLHLRFHSGICLKSQLNSSKVVQVIAGHEAGTEREREGER